MTAQSPAQRQAKRRKLKSDKGLKKVEVWVPVDSVQIVKELERRLCAPQPDYDACEYKGLRLHGHGQATMNHKMIDDSQS